MNRFLILLCLFVVATFAVTGLAAPEPSAEAPKVYGEPGEGHIRVETEGGTNRWEHPGVYWLPKGTTLLEFVKLAGPKDLIGDGTDQPFIEVYQGAKHRGSFFLPRIRPGTPKGTFQLEDGDVLSTVEAMT